MMLDSAADNPVLDNDDGFSGSNLVPDNDAGFEPTCQWFTEKIKKNVFWILFMVQYNYLGTLEN